MEKLFDETWFFGNLSAPGDRIQLDEDEATHLRKALRLSSGDMVLVSNGHGKVHQAHVEYEGNKSFLAAESLFKAEPNPPGLTLLLPILKGKDTEDPVEGVCQLNIRTIQLVITDHTQIFKGQEHGKLLERLRAKSLVALKQAKKSWLTEIIAPTPLREWVEKNPRAPLIWVHPGDDRLPEKPKEDLALLTGPEGGFSKSEVDWLTSLDCYRMSLGDTRIRATHAPLLACGKMFSKIHM